jgi:hypothetical protein
MVMQLVWMLVILLQLLLNQLVQNQQLLLLQLALGTISIVISNMNMQSNYKRAHSNTL